MTEYSDYFEVEDEIVIEYICFECSIGFSYLSDYKDHMQTHEAQEIKPPQKNQEVMKYECSTCESVFDSLAEIRYHIASYHPEQNYYHCDKCPKYYRNKKGIYAHLYYRRCHAFDKFGFAGFEEKEGHDQTHTPDSCKCDVCGKGFRRKINVRDHMLCHKDKKMYQCSECSRIFKDKKTLSNHMGSVHSDERPYRCNQCPMTFKIQKYLSQHQRIVHSGLGNIYKCDLCSASFNRKQNLQLHQRIHSDVRDFHCSKCTAAFKSNKELVRHTIVHILYRCEYCGDMVEGLKNFTNHQRKDCPMGMEVTEPRGVK